MKAVTRVTSKGRVVIPKPVREQLRWAAGTRLAVDIMGDGALRLTPLAAADSIDSLYGCLRHLPKDLSRLSKPSTGPRILSSTLTPSLLPPVG